MRFQITSADDGTDVGGTGGFFQPGGNFIMVIRGGTTINATLKRYDPIADDYFDDVDVDNFYQITGEWRHSVLAGPEDKFVIGVTTATGTWNVYARLLRHN